MMHRTCTVRYVARTVADGDTVWRRRSSIAPPNEEARTVPLGSCCCCGFGCRKEAAKRCVGMRESLWKHKTRLGVTGGSGETREVRPSVGRRRSSSVVAGTKRRLAGELQQEAASRIKRIRRETRMSEKRREKPQPHSHSLLLGQGWRSLSRRRHKEEGEAEVLRLVTRERLGCSDLCRGSNLER
ncbi:unnamed protein product [Heligmosomoides polygyrus]|uniref:Uncharacterized protein n=1 Tax=Heligmosomoides polygyrus TaxID=6339 RepID=A0A183F1S8_HELPZ|nr:unnamed protein product [Heligmosomoides polygyrus]